MKQKSFYSLLLAGVVVLAEVSFMSCKEEIVIKDSPVCNEYITFSVPEIVDISNSQTRAATEPVVVERKTLRSFKGDSMRLKVTEEDYFAVRGEVTDKAATRGSLVTSSAGISPFGVSCSVYPAAGTYTSYGCGSYFYKESAAPNTPMDYFWPTSDYKVSFFAYYPYNNAAFTVSSSAATTGSPVYAYTIPSTIANQVDVMTAQVTDHLAGSQGALALTFSHNCVAIKINITNNSGDATTVNSVAIEGVEYSGTLHDGTWTLSGSLNSSSTNPFSLSYGSSIADGATADITGTSNIFIMLPQTLTSSAKLKIVTTDDTYETAISGSWVAGKTYTYSITKSASSIDLSMVDNAGNARAAMTTANCYLVHAAGDYKIPLVYGNAIKNGENNVVAYYPGKDGPITDGTDRFVNHNDNGIIGPWITKSGDGINSGMGITISSAELIGQDISGLITSVSVSGDYLCFTVGTFGTGNALIAVKDEIGDIVWSWHIWATDNDLANTTVVATGSHNYTVAPVNLGWVPTGGGGKQGYCPYYQWGRKDPFIPSTGTGNNNRVTYDINNNKYIYQITRRLSTTATIGDNIKNPTYFYYNNSTNPYNYGPCNTTYYNMWDAQNCSAVNITDNSIASTATKKTIYDPCPPDFCVPTANLYYYIASNYSSFFEWDDTNKGCTWTKDTPNVYFPAAGARRWDNAELVQVGTSGLYWSATPGDQYNRRYDLKFVSSIAFCSMESIGNGHPVRPVVEE